MNEKAIEALPKDLTKETFSISMYVHYHKGSNFRVDGYDRFVFGKFKYLRFALALLTMDDNCTQVGSIKENEFRVTSNTIKRTHELISFFTNEFTIHQHTRLQFAEEAATQKEELTDEYIASVIKKFHTEQNLKVELLVLLGNYYQYADTYKSLKSLAKIKEEEELKDIFSAGDFNNVNPAEPANTILTN